MSLKLFRDYKNANKIIKSTKSVTLKSTFDTKLQREFVSKQKAGGGAKKAGNIRDGRPSMPEQFATSRYFKREAANSTNAVVHTLSRSMSIRKQQDSHKIVSWQNYIRMTFY